MNFYEFTLIKDNIVEDAENQIQLVADGYRRELAQFADPETHRGIRAENGHTVGPCRMT